MCICVYICKIIIVMIIIVNVLNFYYVLDTVLVTEVFCLRIT